MKSPRNSLRTSVTVLIALFVLLTISVVAAQFPLGVWSSAVALGIAAMKTGLVAWYFMHLRDESSLVRVISLTGVFCLTIMLMLLTADYGDRKLERLEVYQSDICFGLPRR